MEKGHYDGTQLDGLNAVAVFVAPGNMFSGPKWKAALYLDNSATEEQKEALSKIFSGQSGGFFSAGGQFYWRNAWDKVRSNSVWNGWKASLATHP